MITNNQIESYPSALSVIEGYINDGINVECVFNNLNDIFIIHNNNKEYVAYKSLSTTKWGGLYRIVKLNNSSLNFIADVFTEERCNELMATL